MKLTNISKKLISFFKKSQHIKYIKHTKGTDILLTELYNAILMSYNYLSEIKYNFEIKKLTNSSQIKMPKSSDLSYFPDVVKTHIVEQSKTELSYTFSLYDRIVEVNFIVEEPSNACNIEQYNTYVNSKF